MARQILDYDPGEIGPVRGRHSADFCRIAQQNGNDEVIALSCERAKQSVLLFRGHNCRWHRRQTAASPNEAMHMSMTLHHDLRNMSRFARGFLRRRKNFCEAIGNQFSAPANFGLQHNI
jgi:hypothetical protein